MDTQPTGKTANIATVVIKLLVEKPASPLMPCPDVQPFASRAPKTIAIPPAMGHVKDSFDYARYSPPSPSSFQNAAASPGTTNASSRSSLQQIHEEVLHPGDLVGEGLELAGETLRIVPAPERVSHHDDAYHSTLRNRWENTELVDGEVEEEIKPARVLEVVKRLGNGSYAVVYLVREVDPRFASSSARDFSRCRN